MSLANAIPATTLGVVKQYKDTLVHVEEMLGCFYGA
jgi:hypothetical protein